MNEFISYGRFKCRELKPHKNQGMELTFVEKGVLEWMTEGKTEHVEAGSVYFTLPWQAHGSINPTEPDNTIWHVLFHLDREYPHPRADFRFPRTLGFSSAEMSTLSRVFAASPRHSFTATPLLRNLMPTLIVELQSTHELRDAHARSLLRTILVELKRIVAGETVDARQLSYSEQRVRALIDRLPRTCDQEWTLAQMAASCGIQRTQFNNVFRKLTGSTPMEYLFRIRMEHAKSLLRETDRKIIDIAFECGYSTSQYFSNSFKQATGLTPTEYRRHSGELSAAESRDWKNIQFRSEEEERRRVEEFSSQ